MWHRSRLFTRPFSHAPVFLSFVLSHGFFIFANPFPMSSQSFLLALPIWFFWCIFRFRQLYQEFGESSLPDISCVYSRVHSRIPFSLCIHYAFSDAFIRPHINDFMCFKTSSRVFRCIPPPSAWPVLGCFLGTLAILSLCVPWCLRIVESSARSLVFPVLSLCTCFVVMCFSHHSPRVSEGLNLRSCPKLRCILNIGHLYSKNTYEKAYVYLPPG